ncbi:uncharacterized protein KNAG_0H01620 [Huiozyma naganishii CBS 8797]|uniref:Uncharacterized protein n=1 Tax=Huiozyma naganishii (strain ATCC MYA-139 / BCRC 22969 / CBS 8797 / KCTC 17520 / NBRC 10181 / NCYC 3082 / Yp74L-3) TaxID=1071383 RepID=J7S1Q7_HUIN7|nr:hypothetical protein KNAG_0H01620 [Kazachstania naganishii CBS 8797]CCK71577.1 hypothetical protein KNAG_0H01620 [Kazachstania naganishii CBS 8797]
MKFTSVFKQTKEAVKERFVNLAKKEKKEVFKLDVSFYVRPTGCNICNGIIPHCCCDLLQKVNSGDIEADENLIAYLHEQELIRCSILEQQERESCETITNDSEEVMSIQSSMNWRYNSETSSSVESPVTATINPLYVVPLIPEVSSKKELMNERLKRSVEKTLNKSVNRLSVNVKTHEPFIVMPTASVVPTINFDPTVMSSPSAKAHIPNEQVTAKKEPTTSPNLVCELPVSPEQQQLWGQSSESYRKGKDKNGSNDKMDKTHTPKILTKSELSYWQKASNLARLEYTKCREIVTDLKIGCEEYRKKNSNKTTTRAKASAKVKGLFKKVLHCKFPAKGATSSKHNPGEVQCCGFNGLATAMVRYEDALAREKNTCRKYKRSLHNSVWFDELIRQNINANQHDSNASDVIKTELNGVTERMYNEMALIMKCQKNNLTVMVRLGKCINYGYGLKLEYESTTDPVEREKLAVHCQVYNDKVAKHFHQHLDNLEKLQKDYKDEVVCFSRLIGQKAGLYRRMYESDCRSHLKVKMKEEVAWVQCLYVRP